MHAHWKAAAEKHCALNCQKQNYKGRCFEGSLFQPRSQGFSLLVAAPGNEVEFILDEV